MPPQRHPPTPSNPKKPRGPKATAGPWTAAEDATILRMRNTQPPSPWREVTTAVNALPPGGRTQNAIGKRYQQVLQYDDQSGGPLSEKEKTLLKKAVEDLDSGTDRWWFVAARYAELRKGDADTREMGKVGVKKWWGVVKSEEGESAGGTPKKMGNGKKR